LIEKDNVLHKPQEFVKDTSLFSEWLYWVEILQDLETGRPYGIQYVYNSQHPLYGYSILPD